MMIPKPLYERVAEAARPPAVLGKEDTIPELTLEVLLDDLVKSHAWLQRDLKEPFLAMWVKDGIYDNPDLDDFVEEITYNNLLAFAAMDPVVDLASLREPKTT